MRLAEDERGRRARLGFPRRAAGRIVNFRTALMDVEAVPEIVARTGRIVDAELRSPFAPQYAAREK